jgi:lipopolysaccharide/colanic/teichoic acid biosynthesis glycosyltransferase
VAIAVTGLVLSSPLWPLIAVAVKLDDGGPVFFGQKRWGRGSEVFILKKFRTMKVGAVDTEVTQATAGDPRVTRVGRLLRATGMDELPQFLNILRGDMSFVGPRPLAVGERVTSSVSPALLYEEMPGFEERLSVRPGLTGLTTIYLPKDASPVEKYEMDLRYIAGQSFWGDVRLIALSLWISLRGGWERRSPKI